MQILWTRQFMQEMPPLELLRNEPLRVDDGLAALYDGYYGDAETRRWRAIGARDKADHIVQLCDDFRAGSVLEVGCGDGAVLKELSRRGFGKDLHGLEISNSGVSAVREHKIDRLRSIDAFDGYHLPFADQSIDLVFATHVLEHVEHERLFLQELGRVGKNVFLEVPLENTLKVARAVDNDIGHINFYSTATFRNILAEQFEIGAIEVFDHNVDLIGFNRSWISGRMRKLLRSTALGVAPAIAQQVFVYHAAALCRARAAT